MSQTDRKTIAKQADAAREKHAISHAAHSFLTEWAKGTLRRHPRPSYYSCLAADTNVFFQLVSSCLFSSVYLCVCVCCDFDWFATYFNCFMILDVVNKSNCQPAFASGFLKHRYSCGSGTHIVGNPHYEGGHQRPIVVNVQQLEDEDIMVP